MVRKKHSLQVHTVLHTSHVVCWCFAAPFSGICSADEFDSSSKANSSQWFILYETQLKTISIQNVFKICCFKKLLRHLCHSSLSLYYSDAWLIYVASTNNSCFLYRKNKRGSVSGKCYCFDFTSTYKNLVEKEVSPELNKTFIARKEQHTNCFSRTRSTKPPSYNTHTKCRGALIEHLRAKVTEVKLH
jgi:hypothetical protein